MDGTTAAHAAEASGGRAVDPMPDGPPTRLVGDHVLPAAGVWAIDPNHADVSFIGRRLGLTKVRVRLPKVSGSVVIGDDPSQSRVEVTVATATVASGNDEHDDRLRSPAFLDVERHLTATFVSTSVVTDGTQASVVGDLVIVGVRRPVVVDVELLGVATDPWGDERAVFSASTEIDREDWGITWNMVLATGGLLLSKRVRIEVEVETVRQR